MTEVPTDKPASPAAREELYFDSVKEHRGAYFVEYQPPVADATFATMRSSTTRLMQRCALRWPIPYRIGLGLPTSMRASSTSD